MSTCSELLIKNIIEQYLNENDYVSWTHENLLKYLLSCNVTDTYEDVLVNFTRSALTKIINNDNLNQNIQNKAKKLNDTMLTTFNKRPEIKRLINLITKVSSKLTLISFQIIN